MSTEVKKEGDVIKRAVETTEDFKLRIAAIIRAKPDQIPIPSRPRRGKRATDRKPKRQKPASKRLHACLRSPPARDRPGVDLISDVLPFRRLWYDTPGNAIGYDPRLR